MCCAGHAYSCTESVRLNYDQQLASLYTNLYQGFLLKQNNRPGPSVDNNTPVTLVYPAATRGLINVGLTLVQRRRRWANVKPTWIQRHVSAGNAHHADAPRAI